LYGTSNFSVIHLISIAVIEFMEFKLFGAFLGFWSSLYFRWRALLNKMRDLYYRCMPFMHRTSARVSRVWEIPFDWLVGLLCSFIINLWE